MTIITPPPAAPNRADPATFPDRADAYVSWWATVAAEINAIPGLYARSNILGTVSQSGGVPTGAIIERGSNVNGQYARFADGTQFCYFTTAGSSTDSVTITYPAAFSAIPAILGSPLSGATTAIFVAVGGVTTTGGAFSALNTDAARTTTSVAFVVAGRWF